MNKAEYLEKVRAALETAGIQRVDSKATPTSSVDSKATPAPRPKPTGVRPAAAKPGMPKAKPAGPRMVSTSTM